MFAVGVDVSKERSTVAVLQSKTSTLMKPFEIPHTVEGFAGLAGKLAGLDSEVRIVMEHTGRYYESFARAMHSAGFFVSAINPLATKNYQDGINIRRVKTDKADAMKIARFALDKWEILPQYASMDTIRYNLKTMHRQFQLSSKAKTALSNNLVALLEQIYPGANQYLTALYGLTAARNGWTMWTPSGMWTVLPRSVRAPLWNDAGSGASVAAITSPSRRPSTCTRTPGKSFR